MLVFTAGPTHIYTHAVDSDPGGGGLLTRLWIGVCNPGWHTLTLPRQKFPPSFPEKRSKVTTLARSFGMKPKIKTHPFARLLSLKTTPFPDRNRKEKHILEGGTSPVQKVKPDPPPPAQLAADSKLFTTSNTFGACKTHCRNASSSSSSSAH